jgi:Mn-dependent DtxR family transcriptional regulator
MTPRQQDCLWFVSDFIADRGRSPLRKEIAAGLGISTPAASRLVRQLEATGHVASEPGRYGSLRIIAHCPTCGRTA